MQTGAEANIPKRQLSFGRARGLHTLKIYNRWRMPPQNRVDGSVEQVGTARVCGYADCGYADCDDNLHKTGARLKLNALHTNKIPEVAL